MKVIFTEESHEVAEEAGSLSISLLDEVSCWHVKYSLGPIVCIYGPASKFISFDG